MFDAAGWLDDNTMVGWYACTLHNNNINSNIPNLENQFIRGISPNDRLQNSDQYSGSGNVILDLSNLTAHQHDMNHWHDVIVSGMDPGIEGDTVTTSVLIQTGQSRRRTFSLGNDYQSSYTTQPNKQKTGDGSGEGAQSVPIDINNNIKQYALIFIKKVK
ncbi:Conserved_hypothetical protein [Hexamita inflata]|uniref:Uncharacterized protein n=1 Tax=Hexamita inflata TaxID=28002 RepID=A0AA86TYI8_9EUKA|nr:Conserved hypothetical protein [Hexamita inflata]